MEEYISFTLLDPDKADETTTGYYNTEKTITTKKNDCPNLTIGGSVTRTAKAKQFKSPLSIEDANAKAVSWLNANSQAYANNLGPCRTTKWRGINEICIIEPSTNLEQFDYMVIKYKWALGAGRDFDTFTGFINTGTQWDNKYMGFGHGYGNILPDNKSVADSYIMWAGDNTSDNGVETCLVNFNKITNDHPNLKSVNVRMAGAWYNTVGTGNIDIEITTYKGGSMDKAGYDIINNGGNKVQQLIFSKNIPKPPGWSNDVDKVINIGYITYTKSDATGQVVINY
ncbi:hypothetical protein AR687_15895 [Flavobacteriaceae bacterium CRH]|nr:hypothetical protein AR687_15895 [Flavobacteriaceae bacterium CRH]